MKKDLYRCKDCGFVGLKTMMLMHLGDTKHMESLHPHLAVKATEKCIVPGMIPKFRCPRCHDVVDNWDTHRTAHGIKGLVLRTLEEWQQFVVLPTQHPQSPPQFSSQSSLQSSLQSTLKSFVPPPPLPKATPAHSGFYQLIPPTSVKSAVNELLDQPNLVLGVSLSGEPPHLYVAAEDKNSVLVFNLSSYQSSGSLASLIHLLTLPIPMFFHNLFNTQTLVKLGLIVSATDTQLLHEITTGHPSSSREEFMKVWSPVKSTKTATSAIEREATATAVYLEAALKAFQSLTREQGVRLNTASTLRLKHALGDASHKLWFDAENNLRSLELLPVEETSKYKGLRAEQELDSLLALVPAGLRAKLGPDRPLFQLTDIVLDVGTRPRCFFDSKLVFLSDDQNRVVKKEELAAIVTPLDGRFGPDNRAGIDGCLHRISAMRNKRDEIYGLTLRVGRSCQGNADMISDLLFAPNEQKQLSSILVLGVPGTGKTTLIREMARKLANAFKVIVVDTSNEICGDGDIPHSSVGLSRRMMVPSIEHQGRVMVECVQNHSPDIIVVDEIGRKAEVEAARTVKQRGIRMIASAHGDLRTLLKNPQLNGLVGGYQTVTLGDAEAQKRGNGSKLVAQRGGEPVFDVIIELTMGQLHMWRILRPLDKIVDSILAGRPFDVEVRSREEGKIGVCRTIQPETSPNPTIAIGFDLEDS